LKEEFYISLVGEAFDGYTEALFNNQTVYVKHVSIRDQRYLHKYYEKYRQIALRKGLETEKERVKYVLKEGIWEEKDDLQIEKLEFEIQNLKRTVRGLFLPSQREAMHKNIEERSKEKLEIQTKRKEVMGQTAEDYASIRSGDEILRFLLFKNIELTKHLYSEEEFGELETWEVAQLQSIQKDVQDRLSDSRIQEAVLRPFFSMYLSLCENVYGFYQKPITSLTIYQLRVVLFGRMFYNIFQYTDNIPEDIKRDPQKLMSFSEAQRNKDGNNQGGLRDDADASAVFGATKEDMKSLGEDSNTVSLSEEAKKHGGKLDMKQMMRLAGHDV
tara:strand:+ start:2136 stop:3122 length:987 start_codon:yes stop_codon:yes gene_type:complete